MIDRSSAKFVHGGRTPDVRLGDVRTQIIREDGAFRQHFAQPDRGVFAFLRKGSATLEIIGSPYPPFAITEGTSIGFESGRAHRWYGDGKEPVELFVSSIPKNKGVLQRLKEGIIMVPADAQPYATILKHSVEVHIAAFESGADLQDENVIRRCAEICIMQLIRFAQAALTADTTAPSGLLHDAQLLRAWTAYYAEPQRRWTVKALAEAAGLGRTAFAERFRAVFGAPPLETLTRLRLEQAEAMLLHSETALIEIAFTVGYNSEAAFVRAFSRQYGMPPGRFRAASAKSPGPTHFDRH